MSKLMGEIEVSTTNSGWIWHNTKRMYREQQYVEYNLEVEKRKLKQLMEALETWA